ncbi:hypothetical protein [Desulfonema ishimotonii]|uniref:hypothetical protein n=1 Tax=Desulfonema ishimotonii TaxID=45657 RepID=UPI000F58AC5E|nr:hypothetical protein [Desulfonema ishimotonii]
MTHKRKKIILATLATVFALALIYRVLHPFRQERVEQLTYTKETGKPAAHADIGKKGTDDTEFRVRGDLLAAPPLHSAKVLAPDFFRPIPGVKLEKTPPLPPPSPSRDLPDADEEAAKPPPEPAENPYAVVDRELGKFQVIGLYAQGDELSVFLQREKQVLIVRKGDRLDGKYQVEKITAESITLRADHINDTVHIDLEQFLTPFERERLNRK